MEVAPPDRSRNLPKRYESLDCMRGLAALTVLSGHLLYFLNNPDPFWLYRQTRLDAYPIRILWSAHQAVILFFVLSGFALYLMFEGITRKHPPGRSSYIFICARWARLYPVYIFSIAVAASVYWLLGRAGFSLPPNRFIPTAVFETQNVLSHVLLIGRFDSERFNTPIWSIIHEMRISIAFPMLFFAMQRFASSKVFVVAVLVFAATVAPYYLYPGTYNSTVGISVIDTVNYSVFFAFGALIAQARREVIGFLTTRSRLTKFAMTLGSILVYTYSWPRIPLPRVVRLLDFSVAIAACGLIACALSFPVLERSGVLKWLGKRSYSLYLMHFVCLNTIYRMLVGRISSVLLALLEVALSLLVAEVTCRLVERPSLEWSRRMRIATASTASGSVVVPEHTHQPGSVSGAVDQG